MTNENKLASMDAVGELPDFGNLLLREGGFPHLPVSPDWNEASTKPTVAGVYETRLNHSGGIFGFQLWTGQYWDFPADKKEIAARPFGKSALQNLEWREVQP